MRNPDMRTPNKSNRVKILLSTLMALIMVALPASAATKKQKAERLVRQATDTLTFFADLSNFTGLWDTADDAKAMVIIPDSYRGGFVFGGSGGNGVMIARNKDGSWSGPTFITIGSFSFGLQAGGEVSELILLAMTERGKEGLLSSSAKLGADISIAAGPVGVGAKAQTADILAFSRSRGLYGGLSLEGSILKARHNWNRAYYGDKAITPSDVVFRGVRDNPVSLPLREAAWRLANRSLKSQTSNQTVANIGQTNATPLTTGPRAPDPFAPEAPAPELPVRYDDDEIYGAPIKPPQKPPLRDTPQ